MSRSSSALLKASARDFDAESPKSPFDQIATQPFRPLDGCICLTLCRCGSSVWILQRPELVTVVDRSRDNHHRLIHRR